MSACGVQINQRVDPFRANATGLEERFVVRSQEDGRVGQGLWQRQKYSSESMSCGDVASTIRWHVHYKLSAIESTHIAGLLCAKEIPAEYSVMHDWR